jgi:hypothetical protein
MVCPPSIAMSPDLHGWPQAVAARSPFMVQCHVHYRRAVEAVARRRPNYEKIG